MKKDKKLIIFRRTAIALIILDFLTAITSPFLIKYEYGYLAKYLLMIFYNVLIPLTGLFMVLTFVYNFKYSYEEKRTKKQELVVKQNFWGRIISLLISLIIIIAYILFRPLDLLGIVLMFILFLLSIFVGPLFGKKIIRK